jgi:cell division protein ZipA
MDGLRWLLLLFGVLAVAGIYLYSRREPQEPKPVDASAEVDDGSSTPTRLNPSFGDDEVQSTEAPSTGAPSQTAQKVVTLRVVAAANGAFSGEDLVLGLRGIGMRHGKFGIFHRCDGPDENKVIFSAASLIEPGSFDLENIKTQQIPGISLFMVLPSLIEGTEAFDLMMEAARTLSQSLKAELLDESGSTLSVQRERYLREEVIQFEHGIDVTR